MAQLTARSVVNAAVLMQRFEVNPPQSPASRLWFSDREIGPFRRCPVLEYSTDDFRRELSRVERRYYGASFASIALAISTAVSAILFIVV